MRGETTRERNVARPVGLGPGGPWADIVTSNGRAGGRLAAMSVIRSCSSAEPMTTAPDQHRPRADIEDAPDDPLCEPAGAAPPPEAVRGRLRATGREAARALARYVAPPQVWHFPRRRHTANDPTLRLSRTLTRNGVTSGGSRDGLAVGSL